MLIRREIASLRRTEDLPLLGCLFAGWAILPSLFLAAMFGLPALVLFETFASLPLLALSLLLGGIAIYFWISVIPMFYIGWFETARAVFGQKDGILGRLNELEKALSFHRETMR